MRVEAFSKAEYKEVMSNDKAVEAAQKYEKHEDRELDFVPVVDTAKQRQNLRRTSNEIGCCGGSCRSEGRNRVARQGMRVFGQG